MLNDTMIPWENGTTWLWIRRQLPVLSVGHRPVTLGCRANETSLRSERKIELCFLAILVPVNRRSPFFFLQTIDVVEVKWVG